jgi:hypothetical protein
MSQTATHTPDQGLQRMIRAHLWFGIAGLLLGLITAAIAVSAGPDFLRASPMFTVLSLGLVGTIALSMAGGLLTFYAPARE